MLLGKRKQNFRKLAQLEIPKYQGKLWARCEASDEDPYPYYDKNLSSKSQILQTHNFRTRRNFVHLDEVYTYY